MPNVPFNWDSAQVGLVTETLLQHYVKPSDATFETVPFAYCGGANLTPTSGTLYLTAIALPSGLVVSNIVMGTNAAANLPTHWWFGLYDNNRNQLAMTADQLTAALNATAKLKLPIATIASGAASSFTTTYTGLYYIGMMQAATVPATIRIGPNALVNQTDFGTFYGSSDTGQTTVPAFPHQAGAITAVASQIYAYVD